MRELDLFYDNRKSKVSHYEGRLGVFDYDPEEFELQEFCYEYYLHYCGKGKSVDLPKGCIDTSYMFAECELPPDFTLGPDFDTSNVTNMSRMFLKCILPENFSLGEKFDTSKVTDMEACLMSVFYQRVSLLGSILILVELSTWKICFVSVNIMVLIFVSFSRHRMTKKSFLG